MKNQTIGILVTAAVGVVLTCFWYFKKPKETVSLPARTKEVPLKVVKVPNLLWEKDTSCLPPFGGILFVGPYEFLKHNAKIQAEREERNFYTKLEVDAKGPPLGIFVPPQIVDYMEHTRSNILDRTLSNPKARVWMNVFTSFFLINREAIASNRNVTLIITKSLSIDEGLLMWSIVKDWLISQHGGDTEMAQDVYNEMIRCIGIVDPRPLAAVFSMSLSYMYAMDGPIVMEDEDDE